MKGIIFQPELVGVLLERGEIQTRRVVKPQPIEGGSIKRLMRVGDYIWAWQYLDCNGEVVGETRCPYGRPGDRLYVKEPFRMGRAPGDEPKQGIALHADLSAQYHPDLDPKRRNWCRQWKPTNALFMPQWASRATVEIVRVDVERVQDITEDEAFAAGVQAPRTGPSEWGEPPEAVYEFMRLWDGLNAQRGYPWASNPFVWVLDLKLVTT